MPLLLRHLPCYLLLAVMVVLLPLRGWAGTTMAVGMAAQQVVAAQASPVAGMPDDCPMRLGASSTPTNAPGDTNSPPCSGCDTCELCLAMASFTTPQFHATPNRASTAPAAVLRGFVSADRARGLKPPIS
ncbi:MAG: hypothetical protein ACKVOT_04265 [Polaromonas sp.]